MPVPLSCSHLRTLYFYDLDNIYVAENFMVGYRLVFDRENLKFGENNNHGKKVNQAPSTNGSTSQLPVPTSEQQNISNPHTVAPAIARKAPSKPSAAASRQIPFLLCLTSSLLLLMCLLNH
ncbi:hypothetical protein DVH24_042628 [Malus domestica]|uniref:Xylanase inhibitor C-terminal domain-containing protein n=1 Tax=Malus domestica TaxID=3750 RepID=A0A498I313_MALDO|nr:hypothetical protein DVH24_042628 [Malus domestica]